MGLDPLFSGSRMRAALNGIRPATTPVWFMRQAGRSLPEYRALREGKSMLAACTTPEIAAEITLQPVRRHHVDAAVFFSDIVVPLYLAGADIDIVPGRGPVLKQPLTSADEIEKLTELEVADWSVIEQAAAHVRRVSGGQRAEPAAEDNHVKAVVSHGVFPSEALLGLEFP